MDKKGRLVNTKGLLVDEQGNLISAQNSVIMLDYKEMTPEGEIPRLYNYDGKRFDIKDVMG